MRILLVGHDASLTGAPILLLELHRHLVANKDIKTAIFLAGGGPLLSEHRELSKVFRYRAPALPFGKWIMATLARNILRLRVRMYKPDYIIYNTIAVGAWAEYFSKIPSLKLAWIHELGFVMNQMNRKGTVDKLIRHSDQFIAVSFAVKNNLMSSFGLPDDRIKVINGGIKTSKARPGLEGKDKNAIVIGACGSLIWRKGYDLFIQVANQLKKITFDYNIQFLWVGGDRNSSQWLEAQYELDNLGLDNIEFTGEVKNTDNYYQEMDVFLMTSREDPFPLVNLEAANAGLPIICFDKTGGSTEFVDEQIGSIVPYADSMSMAKELIELIRNPALRKEKSDAARRKAQQYSLDRMNQRIVQLLHHLEK